jgi:hypothetical protein
VRLSWIYGVFTQRYRTDPHIYREYGEELNFGGRATKLEKTARAYFIKWPDQNLESDFCKAIQSVRQFSLRRNEIAHSVLLPVHNARLDRYRSPNNPPSPHGIDYFMFPPY